MASTPAKAESGLPTRVPADTSITLGRFVKLSGLAATGGEAKQLVLAGLVRVNGVVEGRRGRKLAVGDTVEVRGVVKEVAARQAPAPGR